MKFDQDLYKSYSGNVLNPVLSIHNERDVSSAMVVECIYCVFIFAFKGPC